jgi:hypothetical protein
MSTITEIILSDYLKVDDLPDELVRLRLRTAIILLRGVPFGTKVVFKCPAGNFIDGGYVPYPDDYDESDLAACEERPIGNVYTLHLQPRPPRMPPPPIQIDVDEVELLLHKRCKMDPAAFAFAGNVSLAQLVDAAMIHLQTIIHEGAPLKERAPPTCRVLEGWETNALHFLVVVAASHAGGEKYITTIIQLHMDYFEECCHIDKTFRRRILRKYGFEDDDEDDAFRFLWRVMSEFRDYYLGATMDRVRESQTQRVAIQMVISKIFDHPVLGRKIAAATHKARTLQLWLSNEFRIN